MNILRATGGFISKYNSSIRISIANAPGNAIIWFSQVEYFAGAAAAGRYPETRNVFHMVVVNDWSNSTVAPAQTLTVLPTVKGAGELESIYFVSSAPGPTEPGWLEMPPTIAVDGTAFVFGGTEDFFGNQFYGDQFHGRTDEYGIARYFTSGAPDSTTYWSAYRYFRECADGVQQQPGDDVAELGRGWVAGYACGVAGGVLHDGVSWRWREVTVRRDYH